MHKILNIHPQWGGGGVSVSLVCAMAFVLVLLMSMGICSSAVCAIH